MKLIDADALKNFINEVCFSKEWVKYRVAKGWMGQLKCILKYIDNAPIVDTTFKEVVAYECGKKSVERPHGEWIPVSERLPDIAKKCILQLSDGYITMGTYHSIGKWTFIETSIAYVYGKETVIAWMPLPEPYKEEEKIEVEEPITLTDEQITEMWESGYISDKEEYKDGND